MTTSKRQGTPTPNPTPRPTARKKALTAVLAALPNELRPATKLSHGHEIAEQEEHPGYQRLVLELERLAV